MKSNEQIQQEIEAKIAAMTPEEREAMLEMERAADNLAIVQLRQKYGVNIELIPGDRHHIKLDGEVMGYNEFQAWLAAHQPEEEEDEDWEDDEEEAYDLDDEDDDDPHGAGWFNA